MGSIEYLYPKACVVETVERMAARILFYQDHPRQLQEDIEACLHMRRKTMTLK